MTDGNDDRETGVVERKLYIEQWAWTALKKAASEPDSNGVQRLAGETIEEEVDSRG